MHSVSTLHYSQPASPSLPPLSPLNGLIVCSQATSSPSNVDLYQLLSPLTVQLFISGRGSQLLPFSSIHSGLFTFRLPADGRLSNVGQGSVKTSSTACQIFLPLVSAQPIFRLQYCLHIGYFLMHACIGPKSHAPAKPHQPSLNSLGPEHAAVKRTH